MVEYVTLTTNKYTLVIAHHHHLGCACSPALCVPVTLYIDPQICMEMSVTVL